MDIETLINQIEGFNKTIDKIPSMRLGMLLDRVIDKGPLIVGVFEFTCNSHDTGISVRVNIVKDDDRLTIINGTYWYSESTYGFNKFHRLHGAWDPSLEEAVDEIKIMATKNIEARIKSHKEWIESIKKELNKEISKFESMF
tara:strand:+ start:128 stop:553 length:426 start_codon:yes stop_codon:yes gene_type:complete